MFNSMARANYYSSELCNFDSILWGSMSLLWIAGCVQNGVHHDSDTEWTEKNDPCYIFTCKAGIVTKSKLQCYTPCSKPKPAPPGQCCPICDGNAFFVFHSLARADAAAAANYPRQSHKYFSRSPPSSPPPFRLFLNASRRAIKAGMFLSDITRGER